MAWTIEQVPAPDGQSVLHTTAAGHGTAWVFGISVGGSLSTLVFRKDEHHWRRVDVPDIGRANKAAVLSETELWIVGDGTSLHRVGDDWAEVPLAEADQPAQLFGLAAFGGSDVWTAGYAPGSGRASGTVQRWDGTSWTEQALPGVADHWALGGVGGVAADDLWAVGQVHGETGSAIALHHDGDTWRSVPVPTPGAGSASLGAVLAVAADDVWAAGYWRPAGGRVRLPMAAHWDGVTWSPADMPDDRAGQLRDLTTDGERVFGIGSSADQPAVLELRDGSCRAVPGPPVPDGAASCSLHGGTVLPDGGLLVVGASADSPSDARPYVAVLASDG